jgi:hypothetical protein
MNILYMVKTFKMKVNKRFGQPQDKANSLKDLAKLSKIPLSILKKVYERGEGAYENNMRSVRLKNFKKNPDLRKGASMRLSKAQWSFARTYAFIEKTYNKKEKQNQDLDLMKQAREKLKL